MEKNQRRDFIKKSLIGITAATILPSAINAESHAMPGQNEMPVLPSRTLGRTGLKTPLISLGAGNSNEAGFIKACYHSGIKLFFSATYYGEGNNEKLAGDALKGLPRDSFVVGTAVTPDGFNTDKGKFQSDLNVDAYVKKTEESIRRFGLDYIDILLFPYAGKKEVMLNPALLKAMSQIKKQGKARFVGIASHDNTAEALRAAADSKVYDVAMAAYNFKSDNIPEMDSAIAYAAKAGIGVMAFKTLAGVSNDKGGNKPVDSDIALKWVLHNENVSTIVAGMASLEELNKNMGMLKNLTLSDKELQELKLSYLENGQGLYCRQCQVCVPQCRNNLSVPTIMRSYMYAYGYRNMAQAKHTLLSAGINVNPCSSCSECSVNCTSGFNIRERVEDISRLAAIPSEFLKG